MFAIPHELFAVQRQQSANAEPETFTRAQYETLVRETGVFSDVFATRVPMTPGSRAAGGRGRSSRGIFPCSRCHRMRGRTLTPSDDEPGALPVIVLSHRAWSQHFAGDPGVINSTGPGKRSAVPHCRRDAGGLSRTRGGRGAGFLGAALGAWPIPPRPAGARQSPSASTLSGG